MALQPDRQTLKLQAINALDQARANLRGGWAEAREHWRPRNIIRDRVEKHHIAIAVGSVIAGFLAFRWLFSDRTPSSPAAPRRRSLSGFLLNGLWGMAREPLLALATQQLLPVIMPLVSKYVSQFQAPHRTSTPE
ncbi:hypothetical protein DES53_1011042 [Roseimicrobium gellanilyticum]|uniref:Uncharacterized protein n=1 Tax=Roseimicrobium gellanilyticum TaxID=748857 RepID=A0A366HVD4_9BACT|nr:hypothetical protein [Roseimicrobium gellanilyticum]RBP48241.1 hypothetical protein DES53_1011042 [Roseimicrobium gellanilyticum]